MQRKRIENFNHLFILIECDYSSLSLLMNEINIS